MPSVNDLQQDIDDEQDLSEENENANLDEGPQYEKIEEKNEESSEKLNEESSEKLNEESSEKLNEESSEKLNEESSVNSDATTNSNTTKNPPTEENLNNDVVSKEAVDAKRDSELRQAGKAKIFIMLSLNGVRDFIWEYFGLSKLNYKLEESD